MKNFISILIFLFIICLLFLVYYIDYKRKTDLNFKTTIQLQEAKIKDLELHIVELEKFMDNYDKLIEEYPQITIENQSLFQKIRELREQLEKAKEEQFNPSLNQSADSSKTLNK